MIRITKLSNSKAKGSTPFFQGAEIKKKDGEIIGVIKTYITGETKEIRIQRRDNGTISKIEEKDSLLKIATISVFDNGLPKPSQTNTPDYTTFTFSIPTE